MAQVVGAYSVSPSKGQPGQLLGNPSDWWIDSFIAGATITPGDSVFQSTTDELVTTAVVATHAPATDDDAIIATPLAASATLIVTAVAAGFDGTGDGGSGALFSNGRSRNLRYVLANSANFDVTGEIAVWGRLNNRRVFESVQTPDAGNTTLTGLIYFDQVEQVQMSVQAGVAATLVLGVGVQYGPNRTLLGVAVAKHGSETTTYAAGDTVPVLRKGRIWVSPEDAVAPAGGADNVWARVIVGTGALGKFRGNPDGTLAAPESIPVPGWKWRSTAALATPAILEVNAEG